VVFGYSYQNLGEKRENKSVSMLTSIYIGIERLKSMILKGGYYDNGFFKA
jgi:hypothetical protein